MDTPGLLPEDEIDEQCNDLKSVVPTTKFTTDISSANTIRNRYLGQTLFMQEVEAHKFSNCSKSQISGDNESEISNAEEGAEVAEQSRFWNINMACIIAWKAPINLDFIEDAQSPSASRSFKRAHRSLKDRVLTVLSLYIFRFLPILIVLAEVVILISILDQGCKIGYLISGDGSFQMPSFNWPGKPESSKCDAVALLHDWLQESDESAGEAPACLLYAEHLANLTALHRFDAPDFLDSYAKDSQGVEFSDSLEWVQASRRAAVGACGDAVRNHRFRAYSTLDIRCALAIK
jgi:hypothetical protein